MLNRIVLIGRLVKDPELRYTGQGTPVATFRIAVDRPRGRDAEKQTDFIDIVCWRQSAEFASQYLQKGRLVSVDGRLQIREWTAQDGTRRWSTEVIAENVQGLDRPRDDLSGPVAGSDFGPDALVSGMDTADTDSDADAYDDPFSDE